MGGTIRARFRKGVLEPLDKVDLPENKEVTLTIVDIPTREDAESFARAAGSWKGTIDAEGLIRDVYKDRLTSSRLEPRL